MSEKNLVICGHELSYANALAENILEREELGVKVYVFSDMEKAELFGKENPIHILIMNEMFFKSSKLYPKAEIYFALGEGKCDDMDEKIHFIYKYQDANHIIREIFETYVEKTNENVLKGYARNQTYLAAVYSPIRGIGKTRFAIAWGKELAKSHKVLYLNLEEYPGFEVNGPDETQLNIEDLLYFIKQNSKNLGLRLQSAVLKLGDMDYVPPMYFAADLKAVKEEMWIELLRNIVELGLYDYIILDLGECVQGLFQILQCCDCIYTPTAHGESERQKLLRYEQCLERMGLEKIMRITQQFILPENVEHYVKQRMKEEC